MLKTRISEGRLVAEDVYVDHQNVEWFQAEDVTHDAAYAHALVTAISEIGVTADGGYAQYCPASDTQLFLRERAEELMREWGYGEREDE